MGRADELLPIPRRRATPQIYPGMELTDEHRTGVDIAERFAPGAVGAPDVRVLVHRPKGATGPLPLVLSIHGGAFAFYGADSFVGMDAAWALRHGCMVAAVDYRLAPEDPFPAALEDCYAALLWAVTDLDVDPERVIVSGTSSGGALAAGVTLMARDQGGPRIAYQALLIPVLDDRRVTPSMRQYRDGPGFNGAMAEGMWLHYLGEDHDPATTAPYAAPGRAESLAGLPPAFIQVNGLDPLRDEGLAYAQRLLAEGIPVELYCAPGMYHNAPPLDERVLATANRLVAGAIAAALAG
jgi:acetyl esterase/lipase